MANRLASAKSAYLRTATGSPIDWYEWGSEAFSIAKEQDKPILLDIGAVWCHWCHVMDEKTYEHPEVVRLLNEKFVCIKVDRDERPDVDGRYQRAVGAITGQGGWPLTAFLTPEGKVFYGGTYFPPTDAHGRAGFPDVLTQIADTFQKDRKRVEDSAEHIVEAMRRHFQERDASGTVDKKLLERVPELFAKGFDEANGGWGGAPKFPHTGAVLLCLSRHLRTGDDTLRSLAKKALDGMADGGIHDHVEGAFHRYSVDAHWTVPHFEKMAYDNAELLRAFAHGAKVLDMPRYRRVVDGIIGWTLCYSPEDGFLASQDADIDAHDDGDHFTWTLDELRAALTDTSGAKDKEIDAGFLFDVARLRYGVEEKGDMHHDTARNVLENERTVEQVAEILDRSVEEVEAARREVLVRLAHARAARPRPYIDTTRFTDWSAMFASAFLEADAVLGIPDAREHALRAIDRLVQDAWDDEKGWLHRPRDDGGREANGFLEDQAWMGTALVDAYRFAGRSDLLALAKKTAEVLEAHWRSPDGGYFDTADWRRKDPEAAPLAEPLRPWMDQGTPGANAVAARFLVRLGRALGDEGLVERGRKTVEAFGGPAPEAGVFAATWFQALEEVVDEPPVVTVFGAADEPETQAFADEARRVPRPGVVVITVSPGQADREDVPEVLRDVLTNEDLIKDGPCAFLCYGDHCSAPVRDVDRLFDEIVGRGAAQVAPKA